MNIISHMEAAFVVALGLAGSVALFTDDAALTTPPAMSTAAALTTTMPTVVVSAKRMTEAEKRQSLLEESAFASARAKPVNRI